MNNRKGLSHFLSVCLILVVIIGLVFSFKKLISPFKNNNVLNDELITIDETCLNKLTVRLISSDIVIKTGDSFSFSSDSEMISYHQSKDELYIVEKTHVKNIGDIKLTLYIPEAVIFQIIKLETGSGDVNIENLRCDKLDIKNGSGNIAIDFARGESDLKIKCLSGNIFARQLIADSKASVKCTSGNTIVENGKLSNARINCDSGNLTMKSELLGNTHFDFRSGDSEINLLNDKDCFLFDVDRSKGQINLFGESVDDGKYGSGENTVKIDGGIGNVTIKSEKT